MRLDGPNLRKCKVRFGENSDARSTYSTVYHHADAPPCVDGAERRTCFLPLGLDHVEVPLRGVDDGRRLGRG